MVFATIYDLAQPHYPFPVMKLFVSLYSSGSQPSYAVTFNAVSHVVVTPNHNHEIISFYFMIINLLLFLIVM